MADIYSNHLMIKNKAYTISEAKLKKILDYNVRLKEQLELPRIPVSEASSSIIDYCKSTNDPFLPSIWGPVPKEHDPFAPAAGVGGSSCGYCTVM